MKPTVYDLPLKIVHQFYNLTDPIEKKKEAITRTLLDLQSRGFGGVVTNVPFADYMQDAPADRQFATDVSSTDYMQNGPAFTCLRYAADECARLGMRLWIYDEAGYPSGKAGGLTLAEDPDFEARGVVIVKEPVHPGETKTLPLPTGHTHFLYAALYPLKETPTAPAYNDRLGSTEAPEDISPLEPDASGRYIPLAAADCHGSREPVTLTNPTDREALLCAFVEKPLYEGTHCIHNVSEARRYIDVTNRDAVKAFLHNTYDRYAAALPDRMAGTPGEVNPPLGTVEAFFTDEPSFMGCYINKGLYPPETADPYDEEHIPLYPVISYGRDVENAFSARLGYDLNPEWVSIFLGDTPHANSVRNDYYTLLSDLYESAFFEQISDWCARHRVGFSGHLLLEDSLLYHTVFEGNFIRLLRHMHVPGMDMLQSLPMTVRDYAITPKIVSSAAHLYNRPHVMSEVSAHAQGGKVTHDQMYASLCIQYALGADTFNYYYSENFMDAPTYTRYHNALGRIHHALTGDHVAEVLLYYPIETFRMHHRPSDAQYGAYTAAEKACDRELMCVMNTLLDHQIDFDFVDLDTLSRMTTDKDHNLVTPSGRRYRALIVSPIEEPTATHTTLDRLAHEANLIRLTPESAADPAKAAATLLPALDQLDARVLKTDTPHHPILRLIRDTDEGRACLLVNCGETDEETVTFTLRGMQNPALYDPMEDQFLPCTFEKTPDGHRFTCTVPPMRALIVREA